MLEAVTEDNKQHQLIKNELFENHLTKTYQVFWSFEPTKKIVTENYLGLFDKPEMVVPIGAGDRRPFFQLINVATDEIEVIGHRRLPVKDMLNFRDLGGYPTKDGKKIKWGLLYRSDYFWNLNDESRQYVINLGIRSIIDYRTDAEILERPNKDIQASLVVQCNPKAMTAELSGAMQSREHSKETEKLMYDKAVIATKQQENAGDLQMMEQQRNFVLDENAKTAFKKALEVILNTNNLPVDQHCRGGKDRTGFGVALLLGILGVDQEVIMYDYMLTKKYRKQRNTYLKNKYKETYHNPKVIEYLFSFFELKESYLAASFSEIAKKYPSIEDYVVKELGISRSEINRLRAFCLE
ncbi:tyrosine-protein phosphatase [Enterococcus sp. AZ109]|uniref:tyrosine-protein phosphatase n=1 Tax=Enterococcus sp. AZ109 TaxID=2774634 RepID=UPI003F22E147